MSLNLTGNNLIQYPYNDSSPKILNGITFTVNNDGSVTANGTSTATANFLCLSLSSLSLKKGEYTLSSGLADDNTPITYGVTLGYTYENGNRTTVATKNGSISIILTENAMCDVVVTVRANQTLENLVFKPMLNKGTTALPYEPYKSINPENIKVNTGTETKDVEKVVVAKSPNLIPYPYTFRSTTTLYPDTAITATINEDGSIAVSGTKTSDSYTYTTLFNFTSNPDKALKVGETYTISGGSPECYVYFANTSTGGSTIDGLSSKGEPVTAVYSTYASQSSIYLFVPATPTGTEINVTLYPQIVKGTTALPYQKYDREVVWSKTGTSDETTDEETTV